MTHLKKKVVGHNKSVVFWRSFICLYCTLLG